MSGPIRLPVRVERGPVADDWVLVDDEGGYWGNSCRKDVIEQIAAALNATAPGQAARDERWDCADCMSGDGEDCGEHRQAAEGQPGKLTRDESTPEKAEWWRKVGEAAAGAPTLAVAEPAGEQRRCLICDAEVPAPFKLYCCGEHQEIGNAQPQPAETAPVATRIAVAELMNELAYQERRLTEDQCFGVETRRKALAEALVEWFDGMHECIAPPPADPGEELRLLEELTEVDWDFVVSYLAADGGGSYKKLKELLPRLSQLDALSRSNP